MKPNKTHALNKVALTGKASGASAFLTCCASLLSLVKQVTEISTLEVGESWQVDLHLFDVEEKD